MRAKTSKGVQSKTAENHCSFHPLHLPAHSFETPAQFKAHFRPINNRPNNVWSLLQLPFHFSHLYLLFLFSATRKRDSSPCTNCCIFPFPRQHAVMPCETILHSSSSTCSTPPSTSYCSSCWSPMLLLSLPMLALKFQLLPMPPLAINHVELPSHLAIKSMQRKKKKVGKSRLAGVGKMRGQ